MTITDDIPAAPDASVEIVEPSWPATERSPVQLLSLVVAAVVFLVGLLIAIADEGALLGFETDVLRFFSELPDPLERFLIGTAQFVAVLYPVVLAVAFFALRRARAIVVAAIAGGVSALLAWGLAELLDRHRPAALAAAQEADSWIGSAGFPSLEYVAAAASIAVVVGAYVGRRWRHVAWTFVGIVVFFRIISGTDVPVDLVMAAAIGWAVGSGALLAFGVPTHRSTGRQVADALARSGLPLRRLVPASVDARGSTPWFGTTDAGDAVFIKVLGRDERDADLMFRVYRFLRLKNVGDQRPFSSLRRAVEHEALIALKARDVGVRTPHLRTVATVEPNGLLLAYATVGGASLDSVPEPWSDELLHGIWEQVAILRRERIAHRDLRRANVFVDTSGVPWLIDFGFSELAVTDDILAQDVAQLLAAISIVVGAERSVDAAISVIGADAVASALPYLQAAAFAGATRAALHAQKGLLKQLRETVTARTGAAEPRYEPLTRISLRTALMLVCSLVALYVLIPQFADVAGMFRQLEDANWALVAACLACSLITYAGAATGLVAACPVPVSYHNAFEVSLAGSFVNRITPAGVGGIGLNLRFMQKAGANTAEAASRWGVNAAVGGVVHISLATVFILWAGRDGAFDFSLPEMPLLVGLAVVLVGAGVVFLLPYGRRKLLGPVRRVVKHAREGVVGIAHQPARLALMFLGGTLVVLGYLFALYAAVRAFGGTTHFAAVGAVYLAGSAIGQAAPTPGGLGAVEAILIAGLVGAGLDKEIAVPAVLLFRLCTFWIPILPGWASFSSLGHREMI
jgi:glycosyltransferase 2 family protein